MNQKLCAELISREDEDFQAGDIHQSILNVMYDRWNEGNDDKSYADMIHWMQIEYGSTAAFAVLIGKYNQQVENGGHFQYFDNGYASINDDKSDDLLHEDLIGLFRYLKYDESSLGKKVFNILQDFQITANYDDDDDDEDDCYCEIYTSKNFQVVNPRMLDERYNEIKDEWMEFLNESFVKMVQEYQSNSNL